MSEADLIRAIKAHIARGDKAKDKADQHYIAAGQHLKALKEQHEGSWAEWEALLKEKIGIGKSRASELMQIADGRKTVHDIRAITAERTRKARLSSPLRSGEDLPTEDDPGDDDQTVWRRGLAYRAKEAIGHAAFEDWSGFTVDSELIQAAELAAEAWNRTAAYLKGLQAKQRPDDGIPEFLRRTA
jgi:hypothetical protein